MGTRLFVGGLPWAADERELGQAFSGFGTVVDVKVIRDPETGRSRGFGFVTLSNQDEATNAIKKLDGSSIGGRTVTVREAQDRGGPGRPDGPPRGDRPDRGYRSGPPGDGGFRGGPPGDGYRGGPPGDGGYRGGPSGDGGYRGGPPADRGYRGGPPGDRGPGGDDVYRGGPDRGPRPPQGEGGDRGYRSGPPADRGPDGGGGFRGGYGDRRDGPDGRPPRPPMDRGGPDRPGGWGGGGGDRPAGGFGDRPPPRPGGFGGGGAGWARQPPAPTESWGDDRGPRRKEGARTPDKKKGRGFDDWGGGHVEDRSGKKREKGKRSFEDWEEEDDEG